MAAYKSLGVLNMIYWYQYLLSLLRARKHIKIKGWKERVS